MKILLVNPPIYDFTAYDFWLKPLGMVRVAGWLRGQAALELFDYVDRQHPFVRDRHDLRRDRWGRGEFYSEEVPKPAAFARTIPRRYHRFGLPRSFFREFLVERGPFDFALVQTGVTYWYAGVAEVIEDIRAITPATRIVLGGVYATLCPQHARGLGADLVVEGAALEPLWRLLGLAPQPAEPPFWEGYRHLEAGVMKLTDGCPYRCTYCSVPRVSAGFSARPAERSLASFDHLCSCGAGHVAFYDDALLYRQEDVLLPFLRDVSARGTQVDFHTPNALHARFVTPESAEAMVHAGFKTFYLGFESGSAEWHRRTGGKVGRSDVARAVRHLLAAGAPPASIAAYVIIGHPQAERQDVDASMRFEHDLGIRVVLAEFSPIPGTPDGDECRQWADLDEPLHHNKTAFAIARLGLGEVNRLKTKCKALNAQL
ncbi:MAG: radical SAM protein [Planctomycetes bacterium]|nr:radical SAM protein [Planctomycetota bacterium]